MSHPQLIFDFDGTLVDSFQTAINIFNSLADQFSFLKVAHHEVEALRELTSHELIKYLKIPIYKIPAILLAARKQMRSEIASLLPFKNLSEVLHELHRLKVPMGILTSNSIENVTAWLERHCLQHLFNFIHIESSFFGKKRVLKKIIKSYQLDRAKTFYIGDETRDIEAAVGCNIHSIAVSWGFNSVSVLRKHQPHYVASQPEDILKFLLQDKFTL